MSWKTLILYANIFVLSSAALSLFGQPLPSEPENTGKTSEEAAAGSKADDQQSLVIYGEGTIMGEKTVTLNTKYANFVTDVHVKSQQKVKKGDLLVSYDDLSLRQQIRSKENSIRLQKIQILAKQQEHEAKKLDPLPSEYKNLELKKRMATERYNRLKHEYEVYTQLAKAKSVPELTFLEKQQEYMTAETELKQIQNNLSIIKNGLEDINVKISEYELQKMQCQLENTESELELLKETEKYYQITTPVDGICIILSGAPGSYSGEGKAVAVVHFGEKLIHAKFDESAIPFLSTGMDCEFQSNDYEPGDVTFKVRIKKVSKDYITKGSRRIYTVDLSIISEPKPLNINSSGIVIVRAE